MDAKRSRILVVDDEQDIRDSVVNVLGRRAYDVTAVSSGETALEEIRRSKFDLVLMDVHLPGMNGIEALTQIKKIDPEPEVIMITGYGSMESAVESMKIGAYDFVEKPFHIQRLLAIIEKALDRRLLVEKVALYEISKAIFSAIEFDELLKTIVDLTTRVLKADDISLMLFNSEKQLYIAISSGLSAQVQQETKLAMGERIAGWVAKNKEPLILINGLQGDDRFIGVRGREAIRSALVIPLIKNDENIGILTANRTVIAEKFNKSDLYKANIFASLVSIALENSRLYDQLVKVNRELLASQAQLIQSTKLAAVGQLVADMAHEINNPLMVISGISQLLTLEESLPAAVRDEAKVVVDECMRAKMIIQRLLKFSRPSTGEFKDVDVNSAIAYLLSIIEHQFAVRGIGIVTRFAAPAPHVLCDERQLQEVLLNLMNNARDAIASEGAIEIDTTVSGEEVTISVHDSGSGIPPDVMGKIFSPYFTTKAEGNGLGLSICRKIIRNHKGDLRLESGTGGGTRAIITLPLLAR